METCGDAPEFVWAAEMPLLTNRFFLYDGLKLFVWLTVILSALVGAMFGISGSLSKAMPILEMFGWIVAGILYLFVLIAWIVLGNRYPMAFRIAPESIGWVSLSRRARIANRMAVVAGAATGSLTGAGAGLLAMSQESGRLPWSKLRKVKKYPEERVITLMKSWRVAARLYCTPENYAQVAQLVDRYFAATRPLAAALER